MKLQMKILRRRHSWRDMQPWLQTYKWRTLRPKSYSGRGLYVSFNHLPKVTSSCWKNDFTCWNNSINSWSEHVEFSILIRFSYIYIIWNVHMGAVKVPFLMKLILESGTMWIQTCHLLHSRDDSISTMFPKLFFFFCGSILKVTNLDPSQ